MVRWRRWRADAYAALCCYYTGDGSFATNSAQSAFSFIELLGRQQPSQHTSSKPSRQPWAPPLHSLMYVPASACSIAAGLAPLCCRDTLRDWNGPARPPSASAEYCSPACKTNHTTYALRVTHSSNACSEHAHLRGIPSVYALHVGCRDCVPCTHVAAALPAFPPVALNPSGARWNHRSEDVHLQRSDHPPAVQRQASSRRVVDLHTNKQNKQTRYARRNANCAARVPQRSAARNMPVYHTGMAAPIWAGCALPHRLIAIAISVSLCSRGAWLCASQCGIRALSTPLIENRSSSCAHDAMRRSHDYAYVTWCS